MTTFANCSTGFKLLSLLLLLGAGVPGQIQVTRAVYEPLKDKFEFESRGMVYVPTEIFLS